MNSKLKSKSNATDSKSVSKFWCRTPSGAHDQIFITVWQLRSYFCGTSSLRKGRVFLWYMMLAVVSAGFLGSESLRTRDHILLSQIWDVPFRLLLRLAGSQCRYSTPPPHGTYDSSQSQSHFTTGGLPPINSSWSRASWDPRPKIFFQLNSCGNSSYVTSSLTRRCVCLVWICLASRQVYISHIKHVIEYFSFCTTQVLCQYRLLQSRLCLTYISYATTAA
jgi:hypothetical protein